MSALLNGATCRADESGDMSPQSKFCALIRQQLLRTAYESGSELMEVVAGIRTPAFSEAQTQAWLQELQHRFILEALVLVNLGALNSEKHFPLIQMVMKWAFSQKRAKQSTATVDAAEEPIISAESITEAIERLRGASFSARSSVVRPVEEVFEDPIQQAEAA